MQSLSLDEILTILGFGVFVLCLLLVRIFRNSVRDPKPRTGREQDQVREIVATTRDTLRELQAILAAEVAVCGPSQGSHTALVGRAEVELLQKVKKYRTAAQGAREA